MSARDGNGRPKRFRTNPIVASRTVDTTDLSGVQQCPVCMIFGCVARLESDEECASSCPNVYGQEENVSDIVSAVGSSISSSSSGVGADAGSGVGVDGRVSAAHSKNPERQRIIGAKLAQQKRIGLQNESMRSSWVSLRSSDDEDSGKFPKCFECAEDAVLRCNDCARSGILLFSNCDEKVHGSSIIHSRDDFCERTGGFTPSKHPERTWSKPHCTHCLRANSETWRGTSASSGSGAALTLHQPFSVVYHTTHIGRVNVVIMPRLCTYCEQVFGTEASEFDCTPCATGNDWFGIELLDLYVRICEAAGFALSWHAMFEAHSASSMARNEEPFTSTTREKFTEALKIFSAQRCDKRRLHNLDECLKDVVSHKECPPEVKRSIALIGWCAACGWYPLANVHDG